jgi:hypothetical protein
MDNDEQKQYHFNRESFVERPLQKVEGGWTDEYEFYHTPEGSKIYKFNVSIRFLG